MQDAGISKSTAHAWVKDPKKRLTAAQKEALQHYLERLEHEAPMPV